MPAELPPDECHVWWLDAGAVPPSLEALLDGRERARHRRLLRPQDRRSFLAAHALARLALGRHLDRPPEKVALGVRCGRCGSTEHGKPVLVDPAFDLQFSLSHSGARVAVALARGGPVGIDVEATRPEGADEELVPEVLSPAERDVLGALPVPERSGALIRYWVRKEAVLKAAGLGLSVPMRELTVTGPSEVPGVVAWDGGTGTFFLQDLHPGPGHAACVALLGWEGRVIERDGGVLLRPTGTRRSPHRR